jgi:rubrerythrin
MAKQSRAERKAEEAKIIAELDEEMKKSSSAKDVGNSTDKNENEAPMYKTSAKNSYEPEVLHCRKCGTKMQDGVCPKCGYKVYIPMDEQKMKKIRFIVGCVCIAAVLVILVIWKIKG